MKRYPSTDAVQPNKSGPFERNLVENPANKIAIHMVQKEKIEMLFKIVTTIVQKMTQRQIRTRLVLFK